MSFGGDADEAGSKSLFEACRAAGVIVFDPAGLAVAWAASHPAVTAPIIGARNTAQLGPLLAALDIPMTSDLRAEISALSPEPAPATDRNEEKTELNFGVR